MDQPFDQRFIQIFDGALDVGGGELVFRSGKAITVEPPQLPSKNILKEHMIPAPPLGGAVRRCYVSVTHGLQ